MTDDISIEWDPATREIGQQAKAEIAAAQEEYAGLHMELVTHRFMLSRVLGYLTSGPHGYSDCSCGAEYDIEQEKIVHFDGCPVPDILALLQEEKAQP